MTLASPSTRFKRLGWRLYEELLQPSRLDEYHRLLQTALDRGYHVIDNAQWLTMVQAGSIAHNQKVLVMRHDIDTDPRLALDWHRIEQALGCRASYYFREATADADVIRQLAEAGVHVSYHFEELATLAKVQRLKTPSAVRQAMPAIHELFAHNLQRWRERFKLPMDIVCSHGDWMNRHLKMPNRILLQDAKLRERLGIRSECYDDEVMKPFAAYISDHNPPDYWVRGEPFSLLAADTSPLGILTHPKSWRVNRASNLRELSTRIKEALQFKFGQGWR
ncbi:MAG: hypothetical protein Q4A16_07665 [Lautropia sp.]|nr:hypothetical protein [Lautropia sp.]